MQHQQSESSTTTTYRHSRDLIKIIVLLLTGAIILLINIGGWDLWNPDEPRYAQVAREMLQTGNYLIPHINSEIYPDKPPLFFWLIALFSKPFGDVTAASARMPSALASLGVILITYLLGRKLYSPAVGLLSGIILLTTTQFFWLALRANIDVTLTLWTTLAIFLFYCGYTREQNKIRLYVLSYVCMGLANLTKGPVGFAIPLITIALYLVMEKQFRRFRELSLGWGLLIIVAVTALWLVPACIFGGSDYMQNIVFKQTVGRTVDSFSHKQPFYYYVINFPADFNPWTIFIPSAVIFFWRKKKQEGTRDISLPLVWFAGTFIFFSCISGKRNLYLLPLYPAAALLLAKFWHDFIFPAKTTELEHPSKLITIPLYLLFGSLALFSIGFGAALVFGDKALLMKQFEIDVTKVPLYPIVLLFSVGGIAGLLLLRTWARIAFPFALIVLLMVVGFFFSVVSFLPSINSFKSGKPFCDRIAQIVKPTDKLVTFRFKPDSFNYFLNRPSIPVIDAYPDLRKLFSSPEKIYCLIHAEYDKYVSNEDKNLFVIVDETQIGHRQYYLITNKSESSQ